MKAAAYLFGLNYSRTPESRLNGCINDVINMSNYLKSNNASFQNVLVYTDSTNPRETSASGMLVKLNEIAASTWKNKLDLVWIHYSGHGTSIIDVNGDERDGKDECLVPWDYKSSGVVSDDQICKVFSKFNPRTRVIMIIDSCNSGTIGDLKYSWNFKTAKIENTKSPILASILTISGCLDNETSADAYNTKTRQYNGAMTSCLLNVLKNHKKLSTKNVFYCVSKLKKELIKNGFPQTPKLCSSYDLTLNYSLM